MTHERKIKKTGVDGHRESHPSTPVTAPKQAPPDSILQRQQTLGNQAVQSLLQSEAIQARLVISQPNDPDEQKARAAEQVMRTADPKLNTETSNAPAASHVQRKPERNDKNTTEAPSIVHDVLSSPGQPLDAGTRAFFEPRLEHDLGKVQIHDDAKAAESAQAVDAQAYTVGNDVVFGQGHYVAGAAKANRLLAHELTHIVQQRTAGTPTDGVLYRSETGEDAVTKRAEVRRLEDEMNNLAARNEWEGVDSTYKRIEKMGDEAFGLALNPPGVYLLEAQAAQNLGDIRRYKTFLLRTKTSLQASGGEIDETKLRNVEASLEQIEATYGAIRIAPRSEPKSEKKKEALRGPELVPAVWPFAQVERTSIEVARKKIMDTGYFSGMIPAGDYTLGDESFKVFAGTEMPSVLWGE